MITTVVLNPAVDKIYFVENFEPGMLYRVDNVVKTAGGKGINVARVASFLGEKVSSIGFKAGGTGDWLESELKSLGIGTNLIKIEGESRTNNNIIDKAKGLETELLEVGPSVSGAVLEEFLDLYRNILKETTVLVCSGGLPKGVPADYYKKLVEIAKEQGVRVILDASEKVLEEGIKAAPYMIKPNLRELSAYSAGVLKDLDSVVGACKNIILKGVEVVVASLGEKGAVLVSRDKVLFAEVPKVRAVNTIGSGDSLVAGFAAGIARGYDLREALRLAIACAVSNARFMEIGFIDIEYVKSLEKTLEIRDVE